MGETIRGYKVKKRKGISHWEKLLEEWLLLTERYCRVMEGDDAPYFYNERANISLIAGAAWRCGSIALEEFTSTKASRNKQKTGRTDLWIASETCQEYAEAKFKWISLSSKKIHNLASISLEAAEKASRENDVVVGEDLRLAICFFSLYCPKNTKNKIDVDKEILDIIAQFQKVDYHAISWCFPKETREYISAKGNCLPGVVMVLRNVFI